MLIVVVSSYFFFYSYCDHRDLHSFPTRRSSDLQAANELVIISMRFRPPSWVQSCCAGCGPPVGGRRLPMRRSEEHTSELQSLTNLVCRLLLEKKKRR